MEAVAATLESRATALFEEHQRAIFSRTDRFLAVLLVSQWVAAIAVACWITPRTWAGQYYQTHIHIWAAVFLGGAITSFPVFLAWRRTGMALTRYTIAGAQTLMSGLLIHLTGGRIETHFHIFASLAILGFYRDWKVFLPATLVVAGDHFLRGSFWPQSVFGVVAASQWRWLEHAFWMLAEDAFLIKSCLQSVREMKDIARQKAELLSTNEIIEFTVQQRTKELGKEIADRQTLEIQLVQAQKLESIGQLAAGIAHEINTPIQYVGDNARFLGAAFASVIQLIEGYKHLALRARHAPDLQAQVDEITAAAEKEDLDYLLDEIPKAIDQSVDGLSRVASIVMAMKEFSHPGSTEKEPVDLNHLIENTLTVCRNEWKYVAEVETEFDAALPLVVCLGGELTQVVLNLVVNAAHAIASSRGRGLIKVSTRRDGDWVEICVTDTGTGIPEAVQSRIFTPFFTTKEVGKGTGQGLCLARTVVVKKHGGTLTFITAENVGTTFTARLPLGTPCGVGMAA